MGWLRAHIASWILLILSVILFYSDGEKIWALSVWGTTLACIFAFTLLLVNIFKSRTTDSSGALKTGGKILLSLTPTVLAWGPALFETVFFL